MAKTPEGPSVQDQINAALDQALGAGATASKDFLGMPSNSAINEPGSYRDPTQELPEGVKHPPIYQPGAEYMPQLDNWDKVAISKLQARMVQAGLLDDDYRDGWWDDTSAAAFTHVLSDSNHIGNPDYNFALDSRINSLPLEIDPKTGLPRRKTGTGTSKRAPLSLTLSNSDNLAETANEVAQKRLGRTFTNDEMKRFVNSYHATESGAQTSEYNAQGGGGTTEAPPTPDVAANTYAEQVDPVASQARNILPMVKSINDMLNGNDFQTTQPMQGKI